MAFNTIKAALHGRWERGSRARKGIKRCVIVAELCDEPLAAKCATPVRIATGCIEFRCIQMSEFPNRTSSYGNSRGPGISLPNGSGRVRQRTRNIETPRIWLCGDVVKIP